MTKAKIGTVSMDINTREYNYGSFLHSWAFHKFLSDRKLCEKSEIINYLRPDQEAICRPFPALEFIRKRRFKEALKQILFWHHYIKKRRKFNEFQKKYMPVSKKQYTRKTLAAEKLDYDILICDSDTIWTPRRDGKYDPVYFLALDNMLGIKKIAYTPSMGNAVVPDNLKSDLKKYLDGIDYISCRESFEKQVLEQFTDKPAAHLLDPVFLVDSDAYSSIITKPYSDKKYILIYQPVDSNRQLEKAAIEYASKHGLDIIEISLHRKKKKPEIKYDFSAGPDEFISAIKEAEIIFTNSFHAICFSIIFNKDFYAFGRKDNLKVTDFCSQIGLNDRYIGDGDVIDEKPIDYSAVNPVVAQKTDFSKEWLKNAIAESGR